MQPLNENAGADRQGVQGRSTSVDDFLHSDVNVLPMPRVLRRMLRWVRSISASSLFQKPRIAMGLVCVGVGIAGFQLSGEGRPLGVAFASVSSEAGLSVSKLVINGNNQLLDDEIKLRLSGFFGKSLVGVDIEGARAAVAESRWVKAVTARKVYPDTLVLDLVERVPVALWKSDNELVLISADGIAIDRAGVEHMHLPQVVGENANSAASEFLTTIARFPNLVARAQGYVRIASRRWDLVLDDNTRVLLPAEGWKNALAELNTLQEREQILDRDLVKIDMRLADRLVFRLQPDAAKARKEQVEERMKRSWHKT